jgi:uncharacterized protein YdhG (YjbR/CyaY superfamily)
VPALGRRNRARQPEGVGALVTVSDTGRLAAFAGEVTLLIQVGDAFVCVSDTGLGRHPVLARRWETAFVATEEIDRYLGALEEPKRGTLEALRRSILEVVPEAEQGISYGMPAFKVEGKTVAGFAAFKHHLSYLPHSGSVLAALAGDVAGYETSKGSLRFAVDKPLPKQLVRKLVRMRMREVGLA